MILCSVEMRTSFILFSIFEIYDFVVPAFSASCSCVNLFSSRASRSKAPILKFSKPASKASRFEVPRFP
jgi:hypothetical protein